MSKKSAFGATSTRPKMQKRNTMKGNLRILNPPKNVTFVIIIGVALP